MGMKCGKCGKAVSWQWRYCPFCSNRLEWVRFFVPRISGRLDIKRLISAISGLKAPGLNSVKPESISKAAETADSSANPRECADLINVEGRITDWRGRPIVGARISLMQVRDSVNGKVSMTNENMWGIPGWNPHYSVLSGNDGRFCLDVADHVENKPRKYGLYIQTLWQYRSAEINGDDILRDPDPVVVDLSASVGGRIRLGTLTAIRGGAIRIKLVDGKGEPIIDNVSIFIVMPGGNGMDGGLTSGIKDGVYISRAYPAERYGINIHKEGYGSYVQNGILVKEGEITDITVKLSKKP